MHNFFLLSESDDSEESSPSWNSSPKPRTKQPTKNVAKNQEKNSAIQGGRKRKSVVVESDSSEDDFDHIKRKPRERDVQPKMSKSEPSRLEILQSETKPELKKSEAKLETKELARNEAETRIEINGDSGTKPNHFGSEPVLPGNKMAAAPLGDIINFF